MNRHRVMVVEDDADIREALVEILEEQGCEVVGGTGRMICPRPGVTSSISASISGRPTMTVRSIG